MTIDLATIDLVTTDLVTTDLVTTDLVATDGLLVVAHRCALTENGYTMNGRSATLAYRSGSGGDRARRSVQRARWQVGRGAQVAPDDVAAQHPADQRMNVRAGAGR